MANSIFDKATALLARAVHASTPIEEARTSAYILAKFITTHNLLQCGQDPDMAQKLENAKKLAERLTIENAVLRAQVQAGARPCGRTTPKAQPGPSNGPKAPAARWIVNRYPAQCRCCGAHIPRGAWVWFVRDDTGSHVTCNKCETK